MTIQIKSYLEKALIETWGITFAELKGKDNKYSYERGCIGYYLFKKNVTATEIAELFDISAATVYQYRDRIYKEKARVQSVANNLTAIYG
jgi:hypothetical protein